jgi:predicted porin
MNKKLLVAAVGAALVAGPAFAAKPEVSVFGKAQQEVVNISSDSLTDQTYQGDGSTMSRWGIKASQDLGNGLTAYAMLDFLQGAAFSNGSDGDREHFVGLKGSFGSIRLGRLQGIYKTTGGVKWDPFVATFLEMRGAGGQGQGSFAHNGFRNNLIEYATPKIGGGLTARFAFGVDERDNQDGEFHWGASWKGGPLEIIVAGNQTGGSGAELNNTKVGARYKAGAMDVSCQYEDVENGGNIQVTGLRIQTGGQADGEIIGCGLGYKAGNTLLRASIGQFSASNNAVGDTSMFAVGFAHFLSKKMRIYGGYKNISNDNNGDTDLIGAGMRFDFG